VIFEGWMPVHSRSFLRKCGAAEIVAAADGGILYDEQTPQSLAMALRKALELDGEGRNKLVTTAGCGCPPTATQSLMARPFPQS